MSARFVRSPVPSEPSSRVNGESPALSAATSVSSSSALTPAPPAASWLARVAMRGAHQRRRQRPPGAAGVAAQQGQPGTGLIAGVDGVLAQRAHPGRDPVELRAGGQQRSQRLARDVVAGTCLRREQGLGALTGDERHAPWGERVAVEHDGIGLDDGLGRIGGGCHGRSIVARLALPS